MKTAFFTKLLLALFKKSYISGEENGEFNTIRHKKSKKNVHERL